MFDTQDQIFKADSSSGVNAKYKVHVDTVSVSSTDTVSVLYNEMLQRFVRGQQVKQSQVCNI